MFPQPSSEGFLLSQPVKCNIFIIKDFTFDISYIIIYINKAVNTKKLKGVLLLNNNQVSQFIRDIVEDVVVVENSKEIEKLKLDNQEMTKILSSLVPSTEREMLAFQTLSNILAENTILISELHFQNMCKTVEVSAKVVEI